MFVQVFQGKVSDAGKVRAVLERWHVRARARGDRLAGLHRRRDR